MEVFLKRLYPSATLVMEREGLIIFFGHAVMNINKTESEVWYDGFFN